MNQSAPAKASEPAGYYGQPAIHGPHWNWLITGYFFSGGISGGAAAVAAAASLFGDSESERLRDHALLVSIRGAPPLPCLPHSDLGRPARFHHMVRAFRPSSPMSMGTWGLSVFSILETAGAATVRMRAGSWESGSDRHLWQRRPCSRQMVQRGSSWLATQVRSWPRPPCPSGPDAGTAGTALSFIGDFVGLRRNSAINACQQCDEHDGDALTIIEASLRSQGRAARGVGGVTWRRG